MVVAHDLDHAEPAVDLRVDDRREEVVDLEQRLRRLGLGVVRFGDDGGIIGSEA